MTFNEKTNWDCSNEQAEWKSIDGLCQIITIINSMTFCEVTQYKYVFNDNCVHWLYQHFILLWKRTSQNFWFTKDVKFGLHSSVLIEQQVLLSFDTCL